MVNIIGDLYHKLGIDGQINICTDTRKIKNGDIYIALKGDNFNGNKFAQQAIDKGAKIAIIDEGTPSENIVKVKDSLTFLQKLATYHRQQFDIPVIAIAGSNGKTTTKNLIEICLNSKYKTTCTLGNFNNHIGVPLSLLRLNNQTEIGIIEIGTNNPGEIKLLCDITMPTHGVITNIGKEHLEGFITIEAVAKEESELFNYLHKNNGHAFINKEDKWINNMSKRLSNKTYFPMDMKIKQEIPTLSFLYNTQIIKSHLMGEYNAQNIACAIEIGLFFDVNIENMAHAIGNYCPTDNRSQWITKNNKEILLDAYNANPSSVNLAIDMFSKLESTKSAVLGDMFEMGEASATEHLTIVNKCIESELDHVYFIGNNYYEFNAMKSERIQFFANLDSFLAEHSLEKIDSKYILIKGSRGMRLEKLLD